MTTLARLDALTRKWTASNSFAELVDVHAGYAPTMREDMSPEVTILADAVDAARKKLGRAVSWRPYRAPRPRKSKCTCADGQCDRHELGV